MNWYVGDKAAYAVWFKRDISTSLDAIYVRSNLKKEHGYSGNRAEICPFNVLETVGDVRVAINVLLSKFKLEEDDVVNTREGRGLHLR